MITFNINQIFTSELNTNLEQLELFKIFFKEYLKEFKTIYFYFQENGYYPSELEKVETENEFDSLFKRYGL